MVPAIQKNNSESTLYFEFLYIKYNIPIIFGSDTHYINEEDGKWRDIFIQSKEIYYDEEANFVLDNIKGYNIEMPIAFEWESFNYFNAGQMNLFDLRGASNAFLKTIKDAGYTPVHYASKSYLEYIWLPIGYDIWLAHYTKETSYKGDYVMWQLSSNGKVDGINNYVDINVYYKN